MTRNLRIGLIGGATLLTIVAFGSSSDDPAAPADAYGEMGVPPGAYGPGAYGPAGPVPPGYGGSPYGGGYPPAGAPMGDPSMGGAYGGGYGSSGYGAGGAGAGYSSGYSGGYGGGTASTMSDVGDMQMEAWRARQASSDEMHRQTINGINGTADVYDTQSGTTYYGVDNSSGAHWANPTTDAVVGTDTYADNPDVSSYNPTTNLDDM